MENKKLFILSFSILVLTVVFIFFSIPYPIGIMLFLPATAIVAISFVVLLYASVMLLVAKFKRVSNINTNSTDSNKNVTNLSSEKGKHSGRKILGLILIVLGAYIGYTPLYLIYSIFSDPEKNGFGIIFLVPLILFAIPCLSALVGGLVLLFKRNRL